MEIMMKSKKKILIILFCLILIFVFPINLSFNSNVATVKSPNLAGDISHIIIRPSEDLANNGFTSEPGFGYLYSKIYDPIDYPTDDGDTDYILGGDGDSCELNMSYISLEANQKVIGITLYARGARSAPGDNHYLDFKWRIGFSSYSSIKSLEFTSYSFGWLIANAWNGLDLSHDDINNLWLNIETKGSYADRYQLLSVLYLNLTIETNHDPTVTLSAPNGGEILQNWTLIEWTYSDVDGDNISFDLFYGIEFNPWKSIVLGLIDQDSYNWTLDAFNSTTSNVRVRIEASDGKGGFDFDESDDFFMVSLNHAPTINLTFPLGGEILQDQVNISWNFNDPDGDTMRFNISYQISGDEWIPIIQNLVNATFFEWDLSSFKERIENVKIKIEGIDEFGASIEIVCQGNFTIKAASTSSNLYDILMNLLPYIIIGSTIAIVSIGFSVFFRKNRKKKTLKQKIAKINNKYIDKSKNGTKKVIIEADLLVKRGKVYNENELLNLLFSDKEVSKADDYESIKVLGKLNITTLSEDFWEKIEKFKWEDEDKEEFINDMLALPSNCREQFINEMLERFEVNQ
jgi:hypothetical protein